MKRLLVVLVAFTVMVFASCSDWNWNFGWGTKANALPQTLFNAGVKKQIFYMSGGTVLTYNTTVELTFDGNFLQFNDKTGTFNVTGVSDGSTISVPPQNAFTNQVAIPIAQIIRIVEFN
jgi:hypothetical protein